MHATFGTVSVVRRMYHATYLSWPPQAASTLAQCAKGRGGFPMCSQYYCGTKVIKFRFQFKYSSYILSQKLAEDLLLIWHSWDSIYQQRDWPLMLRPTAPDEYTNSISNSPKSTSGQLNHLTVSWGIISN